MLFDSDSLCYFWDSIPCRELDALLAETASHMADDVSRGISVRERVLLPVGTLVFRSRVNDDFATIARLLRKAKENKYHHWNQHIKIY